MAGSWATPLVVRSSGPDELVVAFALRLMAFQPKTGEPLWTCDGPNIGAYSSPFFGAGIIGLNASGLRNIDHRRQSRRSRRRNGHAPALDSVSRQQQECLGAGVIYQGHIYQVNTMGIAECRDLNTGTDRLGKTAHRHGRAECLVVVAGAGGRPALRGKPECRRVCPARQSEVRAHGHQLHWRRAHERLAGGFGGGHFHSYGQATLVHRCNQIERTEDEFNGAVPWRSFCRWMSVATECLKGVRVRKKEIR